MQTRTPDPTTWDAFVRTHPRAHPLQLSAWADLKSAFGWQADRVALVDADNQIVAGAQLLFRPLPLRLGTLAYLPFGGYVTQDAQWPHLWQAVKDCARQHAAAFLKWEPGFYRWDPGSYKWDPGSYKWDPGSYKWDPGFYLHESTPDFSAWGFHASPQTIQPPRTIMLDISDDDDAILSRMNQSTRRKIRKSLKSAVGYYHATRDDVQKFTDLLHITGNRKAFGVHEPAYYGMAYDLFVPEHAALIIAEYEGQPLAGIMVFAAGDTAQYLYGASSNAQRKLAAGYGVQWQAIQWAKARGCTRYDMWGVPDEDPQTLEAEFQHRSDGLWGPYGMKRGFGGQVLRSAGAWDAVYNPLVYNAYKLALKARS